MFVLVCVNPYVGHFHPLTPLAAALRERGHRVAFATWPGFRRSVEGAGFHLVPAGIAPFDHYAWGPEVTGSKARDLVRLASGAECPDLLVREITDLGALVAAEALGLPCVTLGAGILIERSWWCTLLEGGLDQVRARFGLPADPGCDRLHPLLYLDVVPPWFQDDAAARTEPTHCYVDGGVAPEGPGPAPPWLSDLPRRPLVYVTLGTVYNQRPRLLARILRALAGLDVSVVCTVGTDQDPRSVLPHRRPGSVRVLRWVAQSHVLARSSVVVTHGGYNTVIGALKRGVLPLVVPLGADHLVNAQRCVDLGVGQALAPGRASVEAIATAVGSLLVDEGSRARLRLLRGDRRPVLPLGGAVTRLEGLAAVPSAGRRDGPVTPQ